MSTYFIGDIHGCYKEFRLLLKKSSFNDKKDILWITGDLVAKGPDSLKVIRYIKSLKNRAKVVLGNHDLNLIAVYSGIKKNNPKNNFDHILNAKDASNLIDWLRCQSILEIDDKRKLIMSHAGISPQWDIHTAKRCALEIKNFLSGKNYTVFLKEMYYNNIHFWSLNLNKLDQLRYAMNAFTRMRYCHSDDRRLNMQYKKSNKFTQNYLYPWFFMQNKIPKEYSIFFGHWSTLNKNIVPDPFYLLDTGCCWGKELTMFRLEDKKWFSQSYIPFL